MRVLIIGCGYLGLRLATELLAAGHQVTGVKRGNPEALQEHGIEPWLGDITDPDLFQNLPQDFDWVVNAVSSNRGAAEQYRTIYRDGNARLLQWAQYSRLQKFLWTSSTSVYGQTAGELVDETSETRPKNETSQILVETEALLLDAHRRNALPVIVARVAGIYGPERAHYLAKFLKGEAQLTGEGDRFLNMIHLEDVSAAIGFLLQNGSPGIYNLVDHEPVREKDLYQWLAQQLQRPLPPSAPPNLSRKRGLTSKRVSNAKLRQTGYRFVFPTFREGYGKELLRSLRGHPG